MTDLIEILKTIDTPTVSNAVELLNVRPRSDNFAPLDIRCLFPKLGPMVGYAVTAQVETITQMEPLDPKQAMALYEAVAAAPKPAIVAFQEIGGFRDFAAHCGEVMATVLGNFGAIGLVSDCGVRDLNECRALGFHYFARGSVASHGYCRIASVGRPVQVLGMTIRPGDLLHGDLNGLLEIPREHAAKIPELVEQVRTSERALMDEVRKGGYTLDNLRARLTGYR
jgi:4-hydroxy-4-methyl-2-oxoglutarate aldolase